MLELIFYLLGAIAVVLLLLGLVAAAVILRALIEEFNKNR